MKQPNPLNSRSAPLPPPTPTTLSFPESLFHPPGWAQKNGRVWVSFLLVFLEREIYHNLQPPLPWKRRGKNPPCFILLICLSTDKEESQTRQEDLWGNLDGNRQYLKARKTQRKTQKSSFGRLTSPNTYSLSTSYWRWSNISCWTYCKGKTFFPKQLHIIVQMVLGRFSPSVTEGSFLRWQLKI